jgi:hypothetical protein
VRVGQETGDSDSEGEGEGEEEQEQVVRRDIGRGPEWRNGEDDPVRQLIKNQKLVRTVTIGPRCRRGRRWPASCGNVRCVG